MHTIDNCDNCDSCRGNLSTINAQRMRIKERNLCELCRIDRAALKRPKTGQKICKPCFYARFEDEIHQTIISNSLFHPGERVAMGASGGKDSTVLAHVMKTLNERHNYGLELTLLSIDEGIKGERE